MVWNIYLHFTSMVFLLFITSLSIWAALLALFFNTTLILEWELAFLGSCSVEFTLIFDWVAMLFLGFVSFISGMVLFYSGSYMKEDKNLNRFLYLVLAFVFSMGALICSPNLISILLGWDGLGLVSYALVIYYQNEKSANAGMLTVLSNRVGDVAILLSIALLVSTGGWNFILLSPYLPEATMVKAFIILAAATKSAQIPFSAWLPAAMAAPTPVSALVHSSTLVTAGVYLLIRFAPALEGSKLQPFLLLVSALTMFMAGLGANLEYDLKKIIALSTLSQLGVMISILALGFPVLAFFHLLVHALFKALLFMCAGVIIHNMKEHQDIRFMGSLPSHMPLTITCMNTANLALCGVPFLAGFYSKDLILEVAFGSNINLIIFFLYAFATGLTVCYTFRLIYLSLSGVFNLSALSNASDSSTMMTTPMIFLSIGAIGGGASISWVVFPDPYMICLPMGFKLLALFVSLLGGITGYFLNLSGTNNMLKSLLMYPFVCMSGSMWFMPYLSTVFTVRAPLVTGSLLQTTLDKGWSELLGGQGAYVKIMKNSHYLQLMQESTVKLYMSSFFFWVVIILFMVL